ncbi:MAG: hypothetical protein ABWZ40_03125 [Caulobacterales bacterium]
MDNKQRPLIDRDAIAVEIDHLAEDLLDAADAIERLTRKYSEDVQTILKLQAENIKSLARGGAPKADDAGEND